MKHLTIILRLVLMLVVLIRSAYSVDIGAGVTSYYSIWNPAFIKQHANSEVNPVLLAGPVVSFQFYERYMISGQAMMSLPGSEAKYTVNLPTAGDVTVTSKTRRFDAEVNLMYSFNSYFKIFAGYKRIEFVETGLSKILIENPAYTPNVDVWNNIFSISGPGSGILVALPVSGNLKVTASTSLLYFSMEYQGYFLTDFHLGQVSTNKANYNYRGLGNNSSLIFSYYIPSIDSALNAGVRCQYLKYNEEGDAPDLDSDLNYGLTLTMMYFF